MYIHVTYYNVTSQSIPCTLLLDK